MSLKTSDVGEDLIWRGSLVHLNGHLNSGRGEKAKACSPLDFKTDSSVCLSYLNNPKELYEFRISEKCKIC